jgi:hypothetical protein
MDPAVLEKSQGKDGEIIHRKKAKTMEGAFAPFLLFKNEVTNLWHIR